MVKLKIDMTETAREHKKDTDKYLQEHTPAEVTTRLGVGIDPTIEGEVIDKVQQWYLNSRVLDGSYYHRLKDLANYISDDLGIEVTEADIEHYKRDMQKCIRKNLSDSDKIALVQEHVAMVLQQAQSDRGKSVALQDQLAEALAVLIRDVYANNVAAAAVSRQGRALITFLQAQQKLAQDANEKVLTVLEKMLGFGSTRDSDVSLNKLLNADNAGEKPMTGHDIINLLSQGTDVLPTKATQIELNYEDFVEGEDHARITITQPSEKVQTVKQELTECDNVKEEEFGLDSGFPD